MGTPHRIFRINVLTATAAGGTGGINIQEIEMATSVGGTDECTSGTANSVASVSGRLAARAFDNSGAAANFWAATNVPPGWIEYDFGIGNFKDIQEIRIAAQSAARAPLTWEFYWSDDGVTYTLIKTYSKLTSWSPYSLNFYSFPLPTAVISSISPPNGVVAGGTPVTISGVGFTGATGVTFDGTPGTSFTVVNDTTITVTTPAHALATVPTIVLHPFGDSLPYNFTYGGSDVETHISQLPILFAYLPVQAARVTQVPVLIGMLPVPIPLPFPLVPEVPMKESWVWKTVVNISERGKEQRSALRATPRYRLEFNVVSRNEVERRQIYELLQSYINKVVPYPLYQYSIPIGSVSAGLTTIPCVPANSDFRVGEQVALFNPREEELYYATITAVASDHLEVEPLEHGTNSNWLACPVLTMRPTSDMVIAMRAIAGNASVALESTQPRVFERPGAAPTLTYYNGLLVIPERHSADTDVSSGFEMAVEWLDNGIAPPVPYTNWRTPFVSGARAYRFQRTAALMDYWRAVLGAIKGQTNPFLVPTFRDDFPLAEAPAPGATVLATSNVQFFDFWREGLAYRYIRLQDTSGAATYRRVTNARAEYDPVTGEPVTLLLTLNEAIATEAIAVISYAYQCRLGSDEIVLEHDFETSTLTMQIRAINE